MILNGPLVLYLILGAAGWLILKYRLREAAGRELILSSAGNAFWLWLLVWKGSFILFHPVEFIHTPLAVLYFDGGSRGIWLAALVSVSYLGYRSWRHGWPARLWMTNGVWLILGWWLAYHSLLLVVEGGVVLHHAASAALAAGCLMFLIRPQRLNGKGKEAGAAVWFSIGNVLLMFLNPDRSLWWLSFSKQQIVFFAGCRAYYRVALVC